MSENRADAGVADSGRADATETDSGGGEYGIVVGTYEEGKAYVGRIGPTRIAEVPVELSGGRAFAAAIRDGNPLWWDDEFAESVAGGPVVPPATLVRWSVGYEWTPDGTGTIGQTFLTSVPLPADSMINVSSEIEYFDYLRVGDRLSITEEVEALSEEKQTGAGKGFFLTVVTHYRRPNGDPVALQRNVILRIRREGKQ